jgi:membrane-bound serine protease (ClpP class)
LGVTIFIIGVVLVLIEVFAIPGFGITGISGIILIVAGLTLAMIDNELFKGNGSFPWIIIVKPFGIVCGICVSGISRWNCLEQEIANLNNVSKFSPTFRLSGEGGFVGVDLHIKSKVGMEGIAITILRPSGKIQIDNEWSMLCRSMVISRKVKR